LQSYGITAMLELAGQVMQPGIDSLYLPIEDGVPIQPLRSVTQPRSLTNQSHGGIFSLHAACQPGDPMPTPTSAPMVDFHSHYYNASWYGISTMPPVVARSWQILTDLPAQIAIMDEVGMAIKVLSAPAASIVPPGGSLPIDQIRRMNQHYAELVQAYPTRFQALATIDPFQGDIAAREVEHAITQLGLGGVCIDCSQGDRFLDVAEAQPTLTTAAQLGIPVFIHPVSPAGYTTRFMQAGGHLGTLLARGTEAAASVLALFRAGIFSKLPNLQIVISLISASAFLFAGMLDAERAHEEAWQGEAPSTARHHLYVDTFGFDPAAIRYLVQLLGVDHVLLGSDWPIRPITSYAQAEAAFAAAGLDSAESAAILGGNALRLLAR
jgi:predicted TIM-barrel fold metal-dependent hydrolase